MKFPQLEERVRLAGMLVLAGLLVELLTLFWTHSLSFTLFAILGIPLALAGMAVFFFFMAQRSN
jgi:hypothetical protein